ncbi:MAG: hypothetical protein MUC50_12240, partial [Myxococcota bacterium]|nr:hypothetical protein [Myxococcota bacterium]
MIDDQDNLYFWTARGRLHSVDKRGKLRWRLDLCNPGPLYFGDAYPKELPMVMDYHGTLYFFVGDELYGVRSSDGKVLLQRRIMIPGVRPDPRSSDETLSIAEGEVVTVANYQEHGLAPVLGADGTLYAGFQLTGGSSVRSGACGYVRLKRNGELMSYQSHWSCALTALVGGKQDAFFGVHEESEKPAEQKACEIPGLPSKSFVTRHQEDSWSSGESFGFREGQLVSADGNVYSMGYGVLMRYRNNLSSKFLTRLSDQDVDQSEINAFNRPVMDRDGYIYVTRDQGYNTGVGLIALDPVKIEAEVTDPKAYLLTMPNAPGYLWGLKVPFPALNATTPVITHSGILYTALGGSLLALQLKAGGAQPTVTWEYIAPGGLYPTTMHV